MTFTYQDQTFELFDHPHNDTIKNERAIEIPIAFDFLARAQGRVLEVGNVLAHYFPADALPPRVVVDRYEEHAAVTMPGVDVFALVGQFDTIISISTLEHVRQDEPDFLSLPNHFGGVAALLYLRGLLAPEGRMLVTAERGHNEGLDVAFYWDSNEYRSNALGARRIGWYGRDPAGNWKSDRDLPPEIRYADPPSPRSVWVAEWGPA